MAFLLLIRQETYTKDLKPFVKAMYRKLEPFILVLTYQVLNSSKNAFTGPIIMI